MFNLCINDDNISPTPKIDDVLLKFVSTLLIFLIRFKIRYFIFLMLIQDSDSNLTLFQVVNMKCSCVASSLQTKIIFLHAHQNYVFVFDSDGEGASGALCALFNVIERLNENEVDVFQAVKKLRVSCHRLVQSQVS